MKTLIVYYSQSGQTRKMASMLENKLGADVYEIKTVREYNSDMWKAWDEAQAETAAGKLPELKGELPDLSSYDTILIGGGVWGYTLSNPIRSYMRQTDFSGKKVSAFWTFYDHDEKYNEDTKKEAVGATVVDGLSIPRSLSGNAKRLDEAMDRWIESIK